MVDRALGLGRRALLLVILAASCAKPAPPAEAPRTTAPQQGAARWLPLEDATVFAYDTASDVGAGSGMLVIEVRRPRPESAELVVAGRVRRLQIEAGGIRHVTGGWLLKEPFSLGARYQGDFGSVEITSIDRHVEVPAGKFDGCLETVESFAAEGATKRTTTAYCPFVGIATRRTEVETDEGNGSEVLRLRSFGPRFDLQTPP